MPPKPYHIARQHHLGLMLDELQQRGRLNWRWDYADRRAIYHVNRGKTGWRALDTREAEQLVQAECDALGIRWCPVKPPGGEKQRDEALRWINGPD
ncbi:MAG TPA: hypothetical protein VGB14_18540 [Acidimicrobiales bacterium]|jgi:hypothetical protein